MQSRRVKLPRADICTILGFQAAQNGSSSPTFRVNLSVISMEDGNDRLPRNVEKKPSFYAA